MPYSKYHDAGMEMECHNPRAAAATAMHAEWTKTLAYRMSKGLPSESWVKQYNRRVELEGRATLAESQSAQLPADVTDLRHDHATTYIEGDQAAVWDAWRYEDEAARAWAKTLYGKLGGQPSVGWRKQYDRRVSRPPSATGRVDMDTDVAHMVGTCPEHIYEDEMARAWAKTLLGKIGGQPSPAWRKQYDRRSQRGMAASETVSNGFQDDLLAHQ